MMINEQSVKSTLDILTGQNTKPPRYTFIERLRKVFKKGFVGIPILYAI